MEIILNEKEYAEKVINSNKITSKPQTTLIILSKYYYSVGYRKKKIQELLTDFMAQNYDRYYCNKSQWDDTIDSISGKAGKHKLFESPGVSITKKEIKTIESIKNIQLEQIYFSLMCIAKLCDQRKENNNGWVNLDFKSVFELARVNAKRRERNFKINDLYVKKLIDFPKNITNTSIKVIGINENSHEELFISDFRELGYEYLKYKGQNFVRCANCGILTRGNKKSTKKYCNACAGYSKKETKLIVCVDCGKKIIVDSMANKKIRCDECYKKYRRAKKTETMRMLREKY